EEPDRQGFAHMFEHMMFRGTDRLNETGHFDNIRKVGGNCNAYTSFDQTVYVNEVPSNQLELVLWLEAERMAFLKIDEKGFYTERKVVEEELRMGHNRPYGRAPEKVLAAMYGDRPYAWTPGGRISHLRKAPIEELAAFWNIYYVPNNATLVVVGAVKHEEVRKLATKYFGWIPRCPDPEQPECKPFPMDKPRPPIEIAEDKGPLPLIGCAYFTVGSDHPDSVPLEVLMGVLGGGESSRIYVDIVKEQKIAQIAIGGSFAFEDSGIAGAGGVLLPLVGDKSLLIKTIDKHIEQIVNEPITQAELDKMKNQLRRNEVLGANTVANKASRLGNFAVLHGDTDRINERLKEIEAVTIEDVQRVAKKYLIPNNRRDIRIEPSTGGMLKSLFGGSNKSSSSDEGPAPSEPSTNRIVDRSGPKAGALRPSDFPEKPPVSGPIDTVPEPSVAKKRLANGLNIAVISNHEVPIVSMVLGIRSGSWTERKPGVAAMTMSMVSQGTKSKTAKQMAEVLESNAISLAGASAMDSATISGSALTDKVPLAIELLADMARNPSFPKEEYSILSSQTLLGLSISTKTPEYLADREFRRRIYGEHPYARTVTGETSDVRAIKVDDLKDWFSANVRPDNCTLYLAGDITSEAGFELAEKYLGDWKVEGELSLPALPVLPDNTQTQILLYDRPGSEQSQIRVGHVSIGRTDSSFSQATVMSSILGGSFNSRLNKAIRVEKGLTYGARGGVAARRFAGEFQISTFSKTVSTVDTIRTILDVVKTMQEGKPTESELEDTKTFVTGSFAGDRETPEATIGDLWLLETESLPSNYQKLYLGEVASTSADQVKEVSEKLIHRDGLVIVVVGEAEKIKADLEAIAPVIVINEETPKK
ncbi:MAG: insulinase family protein, partial [Planctomycetes bacterium]|nr:insulinase family protein [Planctomycetota bacterium]